MKGTYITRNEFLHKKYFSTDFVKINKTNKCRHLPCANEGCNSKPTNTNSGRTILVLPVIVFSVSD